jgi:hypothetical protein
LGVATNWAVANYSANGWDSWSVERALIDDDRTPTLTGKAISIDDEWCASSWR